MKEVDISMQDYHADTARPSKSMLSDLLDRPSTYYKKYVAPLEEREQKKSAKHFRDGDLVHCKVHEPKEFSSRYHVVDVSSRATKTFKQTVLGTDKICITSSEYNNASYMADALWNNKQARAYLELAGKAERTFYYTDPETGIELKARPDFITDDSVFVLDTKTARSIDPFDFIRDADSFKYWLSPEIINNAVESVRGIKPQAYVFLCVENKGEKKPDTAIYYADFDFLELGEIKLKQALQTLKQCRESGHWPAFDQPIPLGLPGYRQRELERLREQQASTYLEEIQHVS
ncbi:MAG: PD-(D/E)XK nuclease-like domain-containing protein [Oligoflexales bacterium]